MSVIVNPVIAGICKNCKKTTRGYYVALKNGAYSHLFNCDPESKGQVMSEYTGEYIQTLASDLCGIDSDSEGVEAINRAIDFLTKLAKSKGQ